MFSILVARKVEVPVSTNTRRIDVPELWDVRWNSRQGRYSGDIRPELETFLTEKEAQEFEKALYLAYALTRQSTLEADITVSKRK